MGFWVLFWMVSLLDAQRYSVAELAALYYRRWIIELFFRDVKTTLRMGGLRCSPIW